MLSLTIAVPRNARGFPAHLRFHHTAVGRKIAAQHRQTTVVREGVLSAHGSRHVGGPRSSSLNRLDCENARIDRMPPGPARIDLARFGFVGRIGDVPFGGIFAHGLAQHRGVVRRGMSPALSSSLITAMTPPARCMSSMKISCADGETLHRQGVLSADAVEIVDREVHARLPGRWPEGAGWCWSIRQWPSSCERRSPGLRVCRWMRGKNAVVAVAVIGLRHFDDSVSRLAEQALRARYGWRRWCRCRAAPCPAPRSGSSSNWRCPSVHKSRRSGRQTLRPRRSRPAWRRLRRRHRSCRSRRCACLVRGRSNLPDSIGPPETKIVGMFSRFAAISIAGVILSQLLRQIIASMAWALAMYSTCIGDELARGQRIHHALVAHGDAVIHRDGVELFRHTARRADFLGDQPPKRLQVHVPWDHLGKGVGNADDRAAELFRGVFPWRATTRARLCSWRRR